MQGKYAAIYARISVRHENRKDLSIQTQTTLCRSYLKKKEIHNEVEVYSDTGYSGRTWERPELRRLLSDVKNQKISCVIVKDFSRLGRDYRKTGELAERFFPYYSVRLLSVTEQYDSASLTGNFKLTGICHLMNEWYARDISSKVSRVKRAEKEAGNYLGSTAPYGYKIIKKDGLRLLEQDESYIILEKIIELHQKGYSSKEITDWLWQQKINPPAVYRKSGALISQSEHTPYWADGTVRKLLKRKTK